MALFFTDTKIQREREREREREKVKMRVKMLVRREMKRAEGALQFAIKPDMINSPL